MPTEWTSYWGNAIHGLFVTWKHDPAATGDAWLNMKFTANRYADMLQTSIADPKQVIDMSTVAAVGGNKIEQFTMYVAWASTEASCKAICYDAVDGKVKLTITKGDGAKWHTWLAYWEQRENGSLATGLKDVAATSGKMQFDLKPTVEYAQGE